METKSIPKISVIIPVYNVEAYLAECLDSVCSQSLREIEILCVDDSSTDGSLRILEEYAAADARIRLFRNDENRGVGAARNRGLDAARGEVVYFLDSDDRIAPGTLEKIRDRMERDRLEGLYFNLKLFFRDPETDGPVGDVPEHRTGTYPEPAYTGKELLALLLKNGDWRYYIQAQAWRRSYYAEQGIRFPEGIVHEDVFFCPALILPAARVGVLDEPLFQRRYRPGSIMTSVSWGKRRQGLLRSYLELVRFFHRREIRELPALRILVLTHLMIRGMQEEKRPLTPEDFGPVSAEDRRLLEEALPKTGYCLKYDLYVRYEIPAGSRRLYLYGAGSVGRKVLRWLRDEGLPAAGFLVTDAAPGENAEGLPVTGIDAYSYREGDGILVTVGKKAEADVIRRLEEKGLPYLTGKELRS